MSEYLEIYENGNRFGTISESGEVRILEVGPWGVPELKHGEKLPIPEDMINSIERRIEAAKLNHARDLEHNEQMMAQAASSFDKAKQEKDDRITDLENELEQAKLQSTEPTERSVQQWFFDQYITIEQDTDSVRDNWFEGTCTCDAQTTGNESAVEQWGYEHVSAHMKVEPLPRIEKYTVGPANGGWRGAEGENTRYTLKDAHALAQRWATEEGRVYHMKVEKSTGEYFVDSVSPVAEDSPELPKS